MAKAGSAPSRVRRDKAKPRRKANNKRSTHKGFFSAIASPVVRRLILIVVIVVLLYWLVPVWGPVIWERMLTLFGLGLAIIAAAVGVIIWLVWRGFSVLRKHWNWFAGAAVLALGVWGVLSFFSAPEGLLSQAQATLGGSIGEDIAGGSDIVAGLRIAGLFVLGIIFIAPHKIWHAVRKAAKGGHALRQDIFRPRPEGAPRSEAVAVEEGPTVAETARGASAVPTPCVKYEPGPWQSHLEPILTPSGWRLPPIDILDKPAEVKLDKEDIDQRARLIEEALDSYGVEAKVVQINMGPTVTQFGVEPGWDRKYREVREKGQSRVEEVSKTRIRVDRITALANDLALALAAPSIRIEAPVPGKSLVGIEVPNMVFGSVSLRSAVETAAFQKVKARTKLALALGKGAGGEAVAGDLTRMPHLLIAGATGSGKTVCLNSVICCLLAHNSPDDVRFIMVDPKRVELVTFNGIPHLLAPVVVDSDKAVRALRWLNQEMDKRYREFAQAGVRNIEAYNKDRSPGDSLPYLVLVIDELADLMMTAFDEVEHTLCRLAQLARATGIHLIVATQRPSVDVVTGLIKANFPTRISFAVTSQVDSRTILDVVGAEKLLGRGDMLYLPTEAGKPKRLQGCFVSDAEIGRLVYFWGNQRQMTDSVNFDELVEPVSSGQRVGPADSLLEQARQLAQEHKQISTSFLQRRLRIGYPRAARLMETLKEEGLAGVTQPEDGTQTVR